MAKNETVVNNDNSKVVKPSNITVATPIDVMQSIAVQSKNSKGKYNGVKAVKHYATRQSIEKFADEVDKLNNGKLLVSNKLVEIFNNEFESFNFANTIIKRGQVEGTFAGHKFDSKAGSCDLAVLFASYENMTTKTVVKMMLNHYGNYTRQATVSALIKRMNDHLRLTRNGNCYYFHPTFSKRLNDNDLNMTKSQIEILGLLGNDLRECIEPVLKRISKAVDVEVDNTDKAKTD